MTLMNKIIRRIPKKQVDVAKLEKDSSMHGTRVKGNVGMEDTLTVKKKVDKQEHKSVVQEVPTQEDESRANESEAHEYEILEREIAPEKIICPDCGGITLEGLEFCDKCGGELNYRGN